MTVGNLSEREQAVAIALHACRPNPAYTSPMERLLWSEIVRKVREAMFPGYRPAGIRAIDQKAWNFSVVAGWYESDPANSPR